MSDPVTAAGAIVPLGQWVPATPAIIGDPAVRLGSSLIAVAAQFDVTHSARYQAVRRGNPPVIVSTECNCYSWDVTAAMGAEIPHWVNPDSSPAKMGANGSREMNANATLEWLVAHGPQYGWLEVDRPTARQQASAGCPVVACWENPLPEHSGHIAVLLPDIETIDEPVIAQAGASCLFGVPLSRGFGLVIQPRFFAHA